MAKNIWTLICAYNEQESILGIARRAKAQTGNVLVIDDGSTDKTYDEVKMAGVEVIRHSSNRGKGAAFKTGFINLQGKQCDAIVAIDADGQHLPEEIPRFIEKFEEGYDVVIGKRDFSDKSVPFERKIGNTLYSWLLSTLTGHKIYDPECGFRLYNSNLITKLLNLSPLDGFSYESELLIRLVRSGVNVGWADISTVYLPGRRSKIKPLKHVIDATKVCLTNGNGNHKE